MDQNCPQVSRIMQTRCHLKDLDMCDELQHGELNGKDEGGETVHISFMATYCLDMQRRTPSCPKIFL